MACVSNIKSLFYSCCAPGRERRTRTRQAYKLCVLRRETKLFAFPLLARGQSSSQKRVWIQPKGGYSRNDRSDYYFPFLRCKKVGSSTKARQSLPTLAGNKGQDKRRGDRTIAPVFFSERGFQIIGHIGFRVSTLRYHLLGVVLLYTACYCNRDCFYCM